MEAVNFEESLHDINVELDGIRSSYYSYGYHDHDHDYTYKKIASLLERLFAALDALDTRELWTLDDFPIVPNTPPEMRDICSGVTQLLGYLPVNNFTTYIERKNQQFLQFSELVEAHEELAIHEMRPR